MLDIFQKWKDKTIDLVETKVRLMQLEFIERASTVLGFLIFFILIILLTFAFFLFAGIGLADYLAGLMDSFLLGYLSVAALFSIFGLLIYANRKKIIRKLTDTFVGILTQDREDKSPLE